MQRNESESVKDYKIRLCENKDILGLTWQTISDTINKETGENFSESSYRKWWASFQDGREYQKRKNMDNDTILKEYELKRIGFEKERQRFFDQRSSYSKMMRSDARQDELKEILADTIERIPNGKYTFTEPVKINSDNDMIVTLNDLHIGANVKNAWNIYNTDVCKKYLVQYLQEIRNIKATHNSENCFLVCNGDLINGNIHYEIAVENKENLIEQIMTAAQLVSEFAFELSKMFNHVTVGVVAGNHSRVGEKDKSLYKERLDDLILWYVKAKLQNIANVDYIENIDVTMNTMEVRSKRYLNCHGDYESGKQALTSLNIMGGNVYAVIGAHKHHNEQSYINNVKVLMGGSMLGMDDFCVTKRIVGIPQQMVCICTDNGVKAIYDVNFVK